MCDTKVKILFEQLSSSDAETRIKSVQEIYNIYQNNEEIRVYIINRLVKGLATVRPQPRNGFTNTFCHLLRTLDAKMLELTILKMNQYLFLTNITSSTKAELTAIKLGSILALDALVIAKRTNDIQKETLHTFITFVTNLVEDNIFGYTSALVVSNYFKSLSKSSFEKSKSLIKKELFHIDMLDKCPQVLLLWAGFSDEQKKVLKMSKKAVPSLLDSDTLSKLPLLMKNMREEQMLLIFNHVATSASFPTVWKALMGLYLKANGDLKEKQIILNMAFEVVRPHKTSIIHNMDTEKRKKLIDLVWGNESLMNLFCRQLSAPEFELHQTCSNFVTNLNKTESKKEKVFLEYLFKYIVSLNNKNMAFEFKTSQTIRFSHNLLRFVEDIEVSTKYMTLLKNIFEQSVNDMEKIYVLEQLTLLYTKVPQLVVDFLIKVNIQFNHSDNIVGGRVQSSAKAALLRCLESIQITDLDRLKSLLLISQELIPNTSLIKNRIQSVLQYWDTTAITSKKRSASERDKIVVDFQNRTDSMFVALQSHICLYTLCQPLDTETLDTLDDITSCMSDMKTSTKTDEHCNKKAKSSSKNSSTSQEKTWRLVLTDVLTLFMEQSCHYLRSLSVTVFKVFVSEGHCDSSVVSLLQSTIADIEVEITGMDKKKKETTNGDQISDESEDECESDDSESNDNEDQNESAIKARICAALGAMNVDVDSDSDNNCPDDVSVISDDEGDNTDTKITLKDKRFKILQLREYRSRCTDLLDIVILNSTKIDIRMAGLLAFFEQLNKNDNEMELRLLRTISALKSKNHNNEEISTKDVVSNINLVIGAVQKCQQTKNLVTAFSNILVSLLKMRKSDIVDIVSEFKPIIESCIKEKKSHPMTAVFLTMFDKYPEIGWAFHSQVLNYVEEAQSNIVQFRACQILRKIINSLEIKALVKGRNVTKSFISRDDICQLVANFAKRLNVLIATMQLETSPKHSSIMIGSLTDCLKLCPVEVLKVAETKVIDKIKDVPTTKVPKEFKKTINQFVTAIDFARSLSKA